MKTCLLSLLVLFTQLAIAFDARIFRMGSADTNWNSIPMCLVQDLRPLAASREFKADRLNRTEPAKILFPLITNGMPKDAVEGWLGKPDTKDGSQGSERWTYNVFMSQALFLEFDGDHVHHISGNRLPWAFALVPVIGRLPMTKFGTVSNAFIGDLNRIPLATQALISEVDILEYNSTNYYLTLNPQAFKRLQDAVKTEDFYPVVAVSKKTPVSFSGFWWIHLSGIYPVPNIICSSDFIVSPPTNVPANGFIVSDKNIQDALESFWKSKH